MKVTPLEIRQKVFEKTLRGYDKDEVTAFLTTLSQEWERVFDESKELKIKLEASEREVAKLREVENSLYKTLKTAEDTGANVVEQAKKTADLLYRESQLKSDAMVNEAKSKSRLIMEEAEVASRQLIEEMESRLREMVQQFKALENHRDNLAADLKRVAGEALDRAERLRGAGPDFHPEQFLMKAKRETRKPHYVADASQENKQQEKSPEHEEKAAEVSNSSSFFDSIQ